MENKLKEIEEKEIITEEDIDESDPENKKYDESRIYYVYEHIRLDKMEPFYIGKGKGERAYELYRNDHHDAITDEYGHAVFIIADNLTEEEAFWVERDTIEDYVFNLGYGIDIKGHSDYDHALPHLTNMSWGGEGSSGYHHTEESKQIISEKVSGENHPLYGTHRSEETKQKISEKNKGNVAWNKGKKGLQCHSEETKQMMSEKNKGQNNPMYGKCHSEESKRKMSKNNSEKRKVICITTGETFDSIKEASDNYECCNISKCCKGKQNYAGKLPDGTKLQWMYLEDYNNDLKAV